MKADLAIFVLHEREQVDIRNKSEEDLNRLLLAKDAGQLRRWVRTGPGPQDFVEVTADENLLSQPFVYRGPQELSLYERVTLPEGGFTYRARETVTLPNDLGSAVLLAIRTGGTDKDPQFRLGLIDCTEATPDSMGVLFYNYSQVPLIIRVGKQGATVNLSPSQREWTPLNQERAAVPLKIAAFNEQWKLVYNTVSRLSTQRPTLGLILPEDKAKSDSVRLYLLSLPQWQTNTAGS